MPEPEEQFADDELSRMLALIDHPVPALRANDVMRRARMRSGRRTALAAAAGVILVASVATAAVPGSFLRRSLQHLIDGRRAVPLARQSSDIAASAAARGIAFAPGPQVDVDFRAEQLSGALQVRWADVPSVMLAQTGSSGDAHYALTPGGVIVDNRGSTASYSLVLPRTLARARVRIVGRLVFAKDADSVSCTGARVDSGSCVIEVAAEHSSAERVVP